MDLLLDLCHEEKVTLLLVTHEREIADRLEERFDCSGLVKDLSS
jgi:ABC-type lipoprotein export system ATPase subunit